ncbi:uncharacterized protein LOC110834387 isoform X2 [Zootermopsis nevadensis]|uniref:uncharacterized protein LOC110834387 isoform X2 n=1 Tax=Zootermopsis nevadensis TaxID=136037 RepID=UPI000B8E348F|nr:uncharacterized protein LOC110834387 isoform X2 [Zootermopsis nevadensis]
MCDSAALRPWKRSRSDPDLDRWSSSQSELKRRRGSKSAEDVRQCTRDVAQSPNPPHGETDARDLLQLALDRICELQRKLMQRGTCAAGGPVEEFTVVKWSGILAVLVGAQHLLANAQRWFPSTVFYCRQPWVLQPVVPYKNSSVLLFSLSSSFTR